jgi:hypothetical protein
VKTAPSFFDDTVAAELTDSSIAAAPTSIRSPQ